MHKTIKAPWCSWPDIENKRDPNDLFKVGSRCDAWRSFLQTKTVEKLKKINGSVIYFNKYGYFDKLICEFDCSEKKLRSVIKSLMRKGHEMPVEFLRDDIYDSRAWAYFPLDCFAKIDGCNERTSKNQWQHEVLKHNETPVIQFGISKAWIVSHSCFTLTHRIKHGERYAVMTFNHPGLDFRFNSKRWVAEEIFSMEATRKEMTECLFTKVQHICANHLVTIVD